MYQCFLAQSLEVLLAFEISYSHPNLRQNAQLPFCQLSKNKTSTIFAMTSNG